MRRARTFSATAGTYAGQLGRSASARERDALVYFTVCNCYDDANREVTEKSLRRPPTPRVPALLLVGSSHAHALAHSSQSPFFLGQSVLRPAEMSPLNMR